MLDAGWQGIELADTSLTGSCSLEHGFGSVLLAFLTRDPVDRPFLPPANGKDPVHLLLLDQRVEPPTDISRMADILLAFVALAMQISIAAA